MVLETDTGPNCSGNSALALAPFLDRLREATKGTIARDDFVPGTAMSIRGFSQSTSGLPKERSTPLDAMASMPSETTWRLGLMSGRLAEGNNIFTSGFGCPYVWAFEQGERSDHNYL